MPAIAWTPVASFPPPPPAAGLPARIASPWFVVAPVLTWPAMPDPTHLRITATGSWTIGPGMPECGPDGVTGWSIPSARIVLEDALPGALIGRIGGGTAAIKGPATAPAKLDSAAFAVGTHCVVALPADALGPLLLGFNSRMGPVSVAGLTVLVEAVKL